MFQPKTILGLVGLFHNFIGWVASRALSLCIERATATILQTIPHMISHMVSNLLGKTSVLGGTLGPAQMQQEWKIEFYRR
jgi:hypothetical protein